MAKELSDRFITTPSGSVNLSEVLAVDSSTILFKGGHLLMVSPNTARAVAVALCPLVDLQAVKKPPPLEAGMSFTWTDGKQYVILGEGEEEYAGHWHVVVMRNADRSPSLFLKEEVILQKGGWFRGAHHG
jgi:hypothetical protein